MRFTQAEIDAAERLSLAGLAWKPGPGHFVFDREGIIEAPSPFQERVYFILDMKHFLKRSGTVDRLKQAMFWLPTWHDAREILDGLGISPCEVATFLQQGDSLAKGTELLQLYGMIECELTRLQSKRAS